MFTQKHLYNFHLATLPEHRISLVLVFVSSRQQRQENVPGTKVQSSSPAPSPAPTTYYPFSETQTESQVSVS